MPPHPKPNPKPNPKPTPPSNPHPTMPSPTSTPSNTTSVTTYNPATCAMGITLPSYKTPLFSGGGGFCILSKTGARALIGGLMLGGGTVMVLIGATLLMAYGLGKTPAVRSATQAVGTVTKVL